jgi:predicted dehydrogenase
MAIKIGIIGTGGIAEFHVRGYHRAKGVELLACCDIIEDRVKAFAQNHGFKRTYTDYNKMLAAEDLDLVSVCTPNAVHKDPSIAALKRNINVICEKPIAMNAKEAKAMVEAAHKSKAQLTVGHQFRFDPKNQALKRMVEAGDLGAVYYALSRSTRRVGIPGWGEFHIKEKSAGGPMIDIGVHALDMTLWFMGFPGVQSVTGQTYTKFGKTKEQYHTWGRLDPKTFTVEDFACGMARLKNGATLLIESAWAAHTETETIQQLVLGDKGGISAFPHKAFTVRNGTHINIEFAELPEVHPHEEEVLWFVDCVRGEKEIVVRPEECYQTMQLIDAVYKSAETGREVVIKDQMPIPGKQK